MAPRVLLIEAVDYRRFPMGGQLTFARHMMRAFGDRLALVGISTDDTPVGEWVEKDIDGVTVHFFSFGRREPIAAKPLIPARLSAYLDLSKYKKAILSLGVKNAFVQAPETMLSVKEWGWDEVCYLFSGVENPLTVSRYPGARVFAKLFDSAVLRAVARANLILAAADNNAIDQLCSRSRGRLSTERIVQFPTRVDTEVFHPESKEAAREAISMDRNAAVVVTTGRIHWAKGYDLLLDAFRLFCDRCPNALLFFVGDGESRGDLHRRIDAAGLSSRAFITGNKSPQGVAAYLNASDIFAVASYKEGWSTAMVEALCCGKAIVSTDVSSARDIITPGSNGYILTERNPHFFAEAMVKALSLDNPASFAAQGSQRYGLKVLERDLSSLWAPLRG